MLDTIKQLRYPKEFRISDPNWPEFPKLIGRFVEIIKSSESNKQSQSTNENDLERLIVDMGNIVWRCQERLKINGDVTDKIKRMSRDLDYAWDILNHDDVEIKDHTGDPYDEKMAIKVIAFQQVADLSKDIYYHRKQLILK